MSPGVAISMARGAGCREGEFDMLVVAGVRTAREVWCMKESDTHDVEGVPRRRHAKFASERRVLPICMRWGHVPQWFVVYAVAIAFGVICVGVPVLLDASGDGRSDWLRTAGTVIAVGGLAVLASVARGTVRREYRELEAAGFRRCPACLGGIVEDDDGRGASCGACSRRFGADELRQTWRRAYAKTAQRDVWKFDRKTRRRIRRRRVILWGLALAMAGVMLVLGTIHHRNTRDNPKATPPPLWLAVYVFCVSAVPLVLLAEAGATFTLDAARARRVRGPLRETRGRLCPDCLHDLRGIGDEGVCPECGSAFTRESLADWWGSVE